MVINIPTKRLNEDVSIHGCWICEVSSKWGSLIVNQGERLYDAMECEADTDSILHLHALEWKELAELLCADDGARFV